MTTTPSTPVQKARAWSVHVLTASGAVFGLLTLIAADQDNWKLVWVFVVLNMVIDGIDGTLARRWHVKTHAPQVDGALLDNIVDYFNYVLVPAYLLYEMDALHETLLIVVMAAMALSSGYQFAQLDAKTTDNYFKGFPSYWNVVVFYIFMYETSEMVNFLWLSLFAVLVFVPIKYVYPSRTATFQALTVALTAVSVILLLLIVVLFPEHPMWMVHGTMAYVVYYNLLSVYLTVRGRVGG